MWAESDPWAGAVGFVEMEEDSLLSSAGELASWAFSADESGRGEAGLEVDEGAEDVRD